jgi:hypothetical protein
MPAKKHAAIMLFALSFALACAGAALSMHTAAAQIRYHRAPTCDPSQAGGGVAVCSLQCRASYNPHPNTSGYPSAVAYCPAVRGAAVGSFCTCAVLIENRYYKAVYGSVVLAPS